MRACPVYAQEDSLFLGGQRGYVLPAPGEMVHLSPEFNPPILKGIKVYPDNPFRLDFILDKGNSSDSTKRLKSESTRLIKYFLASLTVPEKDLWVNLSPYEKDRIIPDGFGVTEMGRDLLGQDYILKQITASVIYPEEKIGKEFWDKVYAEARKRYGTTDVPINTFNKVWIVPQKAVVYENKDSAYVVNSRLKVLLEQDYLALEKGTKVQAVMGNAKETNKLGSEIIRKIVIPILEKEVNEGKNFAELRQVYNSLILAIWFKDKIRETLLGKAYVDQKKTGGIDIEDKDAKDKIWAQYIKAFKKGAFNYIKDDYDPVAQQTVPRKYFSGGEGLYGTRATISKTSDSGQLPQGVSDRAMIVRANFYPIADSAMGTNPVAGLIKQPELRQFIIHYLTRRYVHWGLPDSLASKIVNTLVDNGDDLAKGREEVYKITNFGSDPQWRNAYAKYQETIKYESAFEQIRKYLEGLKSDAVVVDLGAGNNVFGATMASQLRHVKVVGVDIMDYHESRAIPNLSYLKQPAPTKLPEEIKAHSVDVITVNAVLHHVDSDLLPGLLAEIRRVLKPDGKVIVIEDTYSEHLPLQGVTDEALTQGFLNLVHRYGPGFAKDFFTFNDWYSNIVVHKWDGMATPYEFRSIEEWQGVFKNAGFFSVDVQNLGFPATGFHKPSLGIVVVRVPIVLNETIPGTRGDMKVRMRLSPTSNVAVVYLHGMGGDINNKVGQGLEELPLDMSVVRYTSSRIHDKPDHVTKEGFVKSFGPEGEKVLQWFEDNNYLDNSKKDRLEIDWKKSPSIDEILAELKNNKITSDNEILTAIRKLDWIRYTFGNKKTGDEEKTFDDEIADLKRVVDATIQKFAELGRGPLQIVLVGESLGGTIVPIIAHELEAKGVKGIVSIAGNSGYEPKSPTISPSEIHPITGKIPEHQKMLEEFKKFKGETLIIQAAEDNPDRNASSAKWQKKAPLIVPGKHDINSSGEDTEKEIKEGLFDFITSLKERLGDLAQDSAPGGIDLTRDKMGLQVQHSGSGVQFKFDPAILQQLQTATGLMPIIIDIRPMTITVPMFLGLPDKEK